MNNINLNGYKEVKKTEYDQYKKLSPKKYAETLRFGFKYFIKKQTEFENNCFNIKVGDDILIVTDKISCERFYLHKNNSLNLLKEAIKSMEDKR